MSDLAPIVSRIPVPGRSLWWLAGAGAAGIVFPAIIGAATALAAYFPIGSFLPPIFLFSFGGTLIVIGLSAVMGVTVGIVYSLAVRSWRPFFLSVILFGATLLGVYPGIATHLYLKKVAFDLLADRSISLVEAIRKYERELGSPPATLADLVPHFLPDVPGTGMSKSPRYDYSRESGMCPHDNSWTITVLAGDGLNFDMFVFCPRKNYPVDVGGNSVGPVGDRAYMYE